MNSSVAATGWCPSQPPRTTNTVRDVTGTPVSAMNDPSNLPVGSSDPDDLPAWVPGPGRCGHGRRRCQEAGRPGGRDRDRGEGQAGDPRGRDGEGADRRTT